MWEQLNRLTKVTALLELTDWLQSAKVSNLHSLSSAPAPRASDLQVQSSSGALLRERTQLSNTNNAVSCSLPGGAWLAPLPAVTGYPKGGRRRNNVGGRLW